MSLSATQQNFCDFLREAPGASAAKVGTRSALGLDVYHYAFRATLKSCLSDLYERTWTYIGDDNFFAAADAHIAGHAPTSWTLDAYGDGFCQSLDARFPNDAEVGELAWIEWALRRCFSGPDAVSLGLDALATTDWDAEILALHPNIFLRRLNTNAAALWSGLGEGQEPPEAAPLAEPGGILVWRDELVPQFRSITAREYAMLDGIRTGTRFGVLCEQVFADSEEDEAIAQIGAMLARWLQDGLLINLAAKPPLSIMHVPQ